MWAAFVPPIQVTATVLSREAGILCGAPWVNALCERYALEATWHVQEGGILQPNQVFLTLQGLAPTLLTVERTLLNFLQTLSGTATLTRQYVNKIRHTSAQLLDTRKTIPGLRLAQKYAVLCGGGRNHRLGLYDAILLKENHIKSVGSLSKAVALAKASAPWVEVEVENRAELVEALQAKPDRILLDNFSLAQLMEAVLITNNQIPLEASGNVSLETIASIAETGVQFISCGALTKHVRALDLSLKIRGLAA
jgi:nicotinate-nucleotide pyrophosphorylase (carboxylating)